LARGAARKRARPDGPGSWEVEQGAPLSQRARVGAHHPLVRPRDAAPESPPAHKRQRPLVPAGDAQAATGFAAAAAASTPERAANALLRQLHEEREQRRGRPQQIAPSSMDTRSSPVLRAAADPNVWRRPSSQATRPFFFGDRGLDESWTLPPPASASPAPPSEPTPARLRRPAWVYEDALQRREGARRRLFEPPAPPPPPPSTPAPPASPSLSGARPAAPHAARARPIKRVASASAEDEDADYVLACEAESKRPESPSRLPLPLPLPPPPPQPPPPQPVSVDKAMSLGERYRP
jgi:hypothetical protein